MGPALAERQRWFYGVCRLAGRVRAYRRSLSRGQFVWFYGGDGRIQSVAGKLGATQGWLGSRAGFIDGPGSWRLCGRNLVNGSPGPSPPDSALSPYSPASAHMVYFLFFFFLLLFFGVNIDAARALENAEGKEGKPSHSWMGKLRLQPELCVVLLGTVMLVRTCPEQHHVPGSSFLALF